MSPPPMPPWPGFHVLLIHFPIALLLVAPVLMFLAMFFPKRLPGMAFMACLVLFLGTTASWVTMKSGEAARQYNDAQMVKNSGEMPEDARKMMDEHQHMGEKVPWMFSGLSVAYLLVILLPLMIKRLKAGTVRVFGTLGILIPYAFAAIYLANTAHKGGLLVHLDGIQAPTAESVAAAATQKAADEQIAAPAPEPAATSTSAPASVPK